MLRSKSASVTNDVYTISLKDSKLEKIKVVMLALRKYRKYYFELNLLRETLYMEYGIPKEISFEKLICWEPAMESLQSDIISIRNIYVFLKALKDAAERLDKFPKNGPKLYYIINESYFSEKEKTTLQIANDLGISITVCYRLRNLAYKVMIWILWNIPIDVNGQSMSFYDLFMEVCYG